jgi:hypothetical protein
MIHDIQSQSHPQTLFPRQPIRPAASSQLRLNSPTNERPDLKLISRTPIPPSFAYLPTYYLSLPSRSPPAAVPLLLPKHHRLF